MRPIFYFIVMLMAAISASPTSAQSLQKWVTGSVQGPYPIGNPAAQPDVRFAFPSLETGARDQSFRLIVRPDLWGHQARFRFSNALGTKPVTFDGVHIGLQWTAAALVPGSNRPVSFAGKSATTVATGSSVWSDPVTLPFVPDPATPELLGRKLAVSFHIVGESGPMTWHAKALTTSYLTARGARARGEAEDESAFPFASWYFLDALDMMAPADDRAIAAFGDSITDGSASTMNGDDRWPDVLARRLHAVYGNKIAVVNAGIGSNQVVGPAEYSPQKPFPGGPSARDRLDRDLLSLSGIAAMVWLEGINDFSKNGNASVEAVAAHEGYRRPYSRQIHRCTDHRRYPHVGAREHKRKSWLDRGRRQAQGSTSSSAPAVCSMGLPISMPRRLILRPAACAPNSYPKARPADLVRRSIRTASATWRWAWLWI